jgi:hypothetical protein
MQLPLEMLDLPPGRESVARLMSSDNLRVTASGTTDAQVLLGLSFLARCGDPVRKEIGNVAAGYNTAYAPIIAVLSVMMDRLNDESVGELVQRDPDNALGHYLNGALFHVSSRESEALEAFRRAAKCSELRCYDAVTGEALFRAVDALGLRDLDRLCALSWTTSRWLDFSPAAFQPISTALSELARVADRRTRTELGEILLTLAGHLFVTNFVNRKFAQRAAEAALTLSAELVAEESPPKRNGYAAAVYGLASSWISWPGVKEWWQKNPLDLAYFLPSRLHRALLGADPALMDANETDLSPSDREALDVAKEKASQTARKLVDLAVSEPDAIFGPYLKGLPHGNGQAGERGLFTWTPVEGLIQKRSDLFQAAEANEEARARLWQAGSSAPSRSNTARMMDIAWTIQSFARDHGGSFPDSLAVLAEEGYLKPPLEAKSLLTGRPYVYVAKGEKSPSKANDQAQFVLFYDDERMLHGWYQCAFASCLCNGLQEASLNEELARRGKPGL